MNWIRMQVSKFALELYKKLIIPKSILQIPLIKYLLNVMVSEDKLLTAEIDDITFQCYRRHWMSFNLGVYEPITREVMKSLFQPGIVFVDGGANVGFYSLLSSKAIGDSGHIYSFEPHPHVFGILNNNIATNNIRNITPLNLALGASKNKSFLYHSKEEPGSHTMIDNLSGSKFEINVIPLDEIMNKQRINLIKLDLEGYETEALYGMKNILMREHKPIIIMEFCSSWLIKAGVSPFSIVEYLRSYNYKLKLIDDLIGKNIVDLDDSELAKLQNSAFDYNLYCVPA